MHCGVHKRYHGAAVHRMLQCAAMASNVTQFKDKDFGQYGLGCVPDALVLSILSPGGKISHQGRFCIGTRSQLLFDLWRKRVDSSDDGTTALVLKFFVRHTNCECSAGFPGCSWSCQCPCGYGDLSISPYLTYIYIHTYFLLFGGFVRHPQRRAPWLLAAAYLSSASRLLVITVTTA
jgi:hypothetical protein